MQEVDKLTDAEAPDSKAYDKLVSGWDKAKADSTFDYEPAPDDTVQARTIKNLVSLTRDWHVDRAWIDTYLAARRTDFDTKRSFETLEDTLAYIAGTGEILAVVMCHVMGLTPAVLPAARLEARGMQYLNFTRDAAAYNKLGRCYIPRDELRVFGLADLTEETAQANPEAFNECIRRQVERAFTWIVLPKEDLVYAPKDCRASFVTAVEMYEWTAATIINDPFIIFDHQVRPTKHRALVAGIAHLLNQ